MRSLDAARMLELSEAGAGLSPGRRAALLLKAAFPDRPDDALLALPLGARDRLLMKLRARLFGETATARQNCRACGEPFELTLTAADIGLAGRPDDEALPPAPTGTLIYRRRRHEVRAVSVADMIAAEAAPDTNAARETIAGRVAPTVPPTAGPRLAQGLAELDPAADVTLVLDCPRCGAGHELQFDAGAFVWEEVAGRAPRILREVAELARAYHWSERDILAMPPSRRAFYLAAAP